MKSQGSVAATITLIVAFSAIGRIFAQDQPQTTSASLSSVSSAAASDDVGDRTAATSSTNAIVPDLFSGTASFTIPVGIPPGRSAVQPNIDLLYRSGNGNGWLGVGWELEVGRIERSMRYGVDYAGNLFVSKTRDGAATLVETARGEYRQRIETDFTTYRLRPSTDGMDEWEATDRAGVVYRFGTSLASRETDPAGRTFAWLLDEIRDTNGNYIAFQYTDAIGGLRYLAAIHYTGHRADDGTITPPIFHLTFELEDRPDHTFGYGRLYRTELLKRLKSITARAEGTLQRRYEVVYDSDLTTPGPQTSRTTARSMLAEVITVGADGFSELPRVRVVYTSAPLQWSPSGTQRAGFDPGGTVADRCVTGDFNGDARTDVACHAHDRAWSLALSSDTSFAVTTWPDGPLLSGPIHSRCSAADFNRDGRTDLACHASGRMWWRAISSGSSWVTRQDVDGAAVSSTVSRQCSLGDFDGDGRADIACHQGGGVWHFAISKDDGWDVRSVSAPAPGDPVGGQCLTGDFDADGRSDLACYVGGWGEDCGTHTTGWRGMPASTDFESDCNNIDIDCHQEGRTEREDIDYLRWMIRLRYHCQKFGRSYHMALSKGERWNGPIWTQGPGPGTPVSDYCLAGDFNGDAVSDLACFGGGRRWRVSISTTDTTFATSVWDSGAAAGPYGRARTPIWERCVAGDFNADGNTDIACDNRAGGWEVALSTGFGWTMAAWTGGPAAPSVNVSQSCLTGDFDGAGKTDIICHMGGGSWNVYAPAGSFDDLVAEVRNSTGARLHVRYSSSATYPNTQLPFVLPVVQTIEIDDGNGVVSSSEYSYAGGYFHIGERDFRGFNKVIERGPVGGIDGRRLVTTVWFHQGDDNTPESNDPSSAIGFTKGKPYRKELANERGERLGAVVTAYAEDERGAAWRFHPVASIESTTYDGAPDGRHTRTEFAYDSYGNLVTTLEHGDLAILGDEKRMERSMLINEQRGLLSLPKTEALYEVGQTGKRKLAETRYRYDVQCDVMLDECPLEETDQLPQKGNVTNVIYWLDGGTSPEHRIAYDKFGNTVRMRSPRGAVDTTVYESNALLPIKTINALGHAQTFEYVGVNSATGEGLYGDLAVATDANGNRNTFAYDTFGRLKRRTEADGGATSILYRAFGDPATQHILTVDPIGRQHREYFDGQGRIYATFDPGDGRTIVKRRTFTPTGQVAFEFLPHFEGNPAPLRIAFEYDALDRLTRLIQPDGSTTRRCYDRWTVLVLDANGHLTRTQRDAYARTVAQDVFDDRFEVCSTGAAKPYSTTAWSYDAVDRLITVTRGAALQTRISYDTLGRLRTVQDSSFGKRSYLYDANGNVLQQTNGDGRNIYFRYDVLDRLVHKTYGVGKEPVRADVVFRYDLPVPNGLGQLASMSDATGVVHYRYDALGRAIRSERTVDDRTFTIARSYDLSGRMRMLTYPDGQSVFYDYGDVGVAKVYTADDVLITVAERDPLGRPVQTTQGDGTSSAMSYGTATVGECPPSDYRLCAVSIFGSAGTPLRSMRYTYDGVGNITSINDSTYGRRTYAYDAFDRLTGATGYDDSIQYTYDSVGNIVWSSVLGAYAYEAAAPATSSEHLASVEGQLFEHDANGNVIRGGGRAITYDAENRPIRITRRSAMRMRAPWNRLLTRRRSSSAVDIGYDGNGERVVETINGRRTIFVEGIYECNDDDCVTYVAVDGRVAAAIDQRTRAVVYLHGDARGSTILITSSRGQLNEETDYLPFGATRTRRAPRVGGFVDKRFTGERFQEEVGLYQLGDRLYDPLLGRFLGADSSLAADANGMFSAYAYANNNPFRFADPTGLVAEEVAETGLRDPFKPYDGRDKGGYLLDQADRDYFKEKLAWADRELSRFDTPRAGERFSDWAARSQDNIFRHFAYKSEYLGWIVDSSNGRAETVYFTLPAEVLAASAVFGLDVTTTLATAGTVAFRYGRWVVTRPRATNPRLDGVLRELWQPTDKIAGGTAGAIRNEVATGRLTKGTSHMLKGKERVTNLERVIREESLSARDRATAQRVLDDLRRATSGN